MRHTKALLLRAKWPFAIFQTLFYRNVIGSGGGSRQIVTEYDQPLSMTRRLIGRCASDLGDKGDAVIAISIFGAIIGLLIALRYTALALIPAVLLDVQFLETDCLHSILRDGTML